MSKAIIIAVCGGLLLLCISAQVISTNTSHSEADRSFKLIQKSAISATTANDH